MFMPGVTNLMTSAATVTINRLLVLLLPGDVFMRRPNAEAKEVITPS